MNITYQDCFEWTLRDGRHVLVYYSGESHYNVDIWLVTDAGEELELGEVDYQDAAEIHIEVDQALHEQGCPADTADEESEVVFVSDWEIPNDDDA